MNFPAAFKQTHFTSRFVATLATILLIGATSLAQTITLRFNEGAGTTTVNGGLSGGTGTFLQQNGSPAFSTNVPTGPFAPPANVSSIDFGAIGATDGNRAIDFAPPTVSPTIGLSAFTLTGWVNLRAAQIGPGGNRIFSSWSGESVDSGIELVQESNGRLRFSVNEAPDFAGPGPFSSTGRLTIDANAPVANWVFFAVTYDASDLGVTNDGVVNYYFGNANSAAAFDLTATYDRGAVRAENAGETGTLTIGNFTTDVAARTASGGSSRVLRGLADELQLYSRVLTLQEIQAVQIIPEPGSAFLCALGVAVFAARRARSRRTPIMPG